MNRDTPSTKVGRQRVQHATLGIREQLEFQPPTVDSTRHRPGRWMTVGPAVPGALDAVGDEAAVRRDGSLASLDARRSIRPGAGDRPAGGEVVAARIEFGRPQVPGRGVHVDEFGHFGRTHVDVVRERVGAHERPVVAAPRVAPRGRHHRQGQCLVAAKRCSGEPRLAHLAGGVPRRSIVPQAQHVGVGSRPASRSSTRSAPPVGSIHSLTRIRSCSAPRPAHARAALSGVPAPRGRS